MLARSLGIVDDERLRRVEARLERTAAARLQLEETELTPDRETLEWLVPLGLSITGPTTISRLVSRPEFEINSFFSHCALTDRFSGAAAAFDGLSSEEKDGVVNRARYAGYIEKQEREARNVRDDEKLRIPADFRFERPGLSSEVVEKLRRVQPVSLGQAARIPGITPAAVAVLRMNLRYEERSANGPGRGAANLP